MRRLLFVLSLITLAFIRSPQVNAASMTNYCYVPPYVGQAVSPNVMLLIDVSGSMSWCAYNPKSDKSGCCSSSSGCGGTYTGTEEGYFDPSKVYRYNSSQGYWEETTGTPAACPKTQSGIDTNNIYQGNCLNFLYMSRIDLVRWALTGGTPDSCPQVNNKAPQNNIKNCDPETYGMPGSSVSCDSYGCILKSTTGVRVRVPWNRINSALLFQLKNLSFKPRMGVMFFSGYGVRGNASVYIGDFTGSNSYDALNPYKNTITAINQEYPSGSTPTAPALWDTYNYFAQQNPQYGGLKPQQGGGDQWRNPMYQCFDLNGDNQCQGSELKLVPCAKNFVILMTDGQWNIGGPPNNVGLACTIDYGFEQYSADPVVPAYWLHKKGFTNAPTGINSKVEAIYGIGLFLGGTGELSLKNVSMYGSFDTAGRNWPDGLSGYPQGTCNMDDCGYGKGSGCTPLPPSSPDWDKNSDGLPDTFYSASDANQIKNAILSAILDILKRVSSGSTVATLAGRSSVSQVVVQPYFLPSYVRSDGTQVSWLGFIKAFWVDTMQNLREDTNLNKVLNLAVDTIFQLFFDTNENQTKAAMITNISTCTTSGTKSINELAPVFDGGCYLANTNPSDRNIYYNKDGVLTSLTTGEASYFANIWKVCSNDPSVLCRNNGDCSGGGSCVSADASCIIRYLRGEDNPSGCNYPYIQRTRTVSVEDFCSALGMSGSKVWKLGDIISSSPAIAGPDPLMNYHFKYNDLSYYQYINSDQYKSRPVIAAISANDGMLHIFRIGYINQTGDPNNPISLVNSKTDSNNNLVGKEEFAFVPKSAIPYLLWYGNPNYCHVPTVDYRMMILDAKINNQWRTILVGAMGFGGKSIDTLAGTFSSSVFVLDLTDWLNNNLSGQPVLLWEKQLPDNTLTLSFPAVAKVGNNWYVLVGSGPTNIDSNTGETYISNAKIFVFNLNDGSLARTVNVPVSGASVAIGDIMPVDVNNDYTDDVAYFGVYGSGSSGGVFGALYRLNLSSWTVSQAFSFGSSPAPVFGAPNYTLDENGNFWVFFGTGKYLSNADKNITYTNYLVGFKDLYWNSTGSTTLSALTDVTGQTTAITPTSYSQMCICDSSGCGLRTVVTDAQGTIPPEVPVGWYIRLNNEAIYSQPMVFGGVVNVLSAVLPQDMCAMEGSSKLYSLYYKSGTPFPRPTVLSPYAIVGNQVQQSVDIGRGVPPFGQPFQITAGSGKEFQAFLQVSTGVIVKVPQQATSNYEGRFLLWIEK
ncbi:pilus assembly protein [Hydrogenobacter hydrogenophilus]|uniref:Type IV pilus assembly protein PilY1 n=1 Tax=Hydrogenobacter hydrogenophilus TaxID=35835 RepID=A0A285NWD3_9AQUI|nr:PilC/PilY family type IV pilus protein [Hydrogenobacter hydrogenophilus]SNZ12206.1 type IV pilus assembly protein PilY1 [Hydrogenobacter hydrogenophilus]